MLQYLKQQANVTLTENGAVTHLTTQSDCLDLFATIGALRSADEKTITDRFIRAFAEDKDLATRLLFYGRDVRGGLGERRVFRVILRWLAHNSKTTVIKNLHNIEEYGRFDDLLCLIGTPCEQEMMNYLKAQFDADLLGVENEGKVSLLAKWLPSLNASASQTVMNAKKIAKAFGLSFAEYRKALTKLRAHIKIIENNLREKDYTFDYSKQPSKAMFKYRDAFIRNDVERYTNFMYSVEKGEAKLHTSTLMPYEIVEGCLANSSHTLKEMTDAEKQSVNVTWANLEDYGNSENAIAVVDTSSSMYWNKGPYPASVAISLGIYFAERNTGLFKNHFIEFSDQPCLIELKGDTFIDKLRYVLTFNRVANTNIEAVFNLILETAVVNNLPQSEMPTKIYLISDMEFDYCVENSALTNFQNAKQNYEEMGYALPQVIFWNVESRNTQQPVTKNEQGAVLVSGCNPKLFSMVASGDINPYKFMLQVLNDPRYANIVA